MDGVINILKPPGMTSNDVVSAVRRYTGIKKVGHTGTLDPGAAGVLPVCLGKATKIVDYIMEGSKTYIAEITLGKATDTYDKYGEETEACPDISHIDNEAVCRVIESFRGVITQRPPAYSAVKINGKRAYELAREGKEVETKERTVEIKDIKILSIELPRIMIEVTCSKGTYIRSLCSDIGKSLGSAAYMSFLLRTATGSFSIKDSCTLDDLTENPERFITAIDKVLKYRSIILENFYRKPILNGNSLRLENHIYSKDELVKIYLEDGMFIGIGRIDGKMLRVQNLLV